MPTRDTLLVERADEIAQDTHAYQSDRGGSPYIEHPRAVAGLLADEPDTVRAVALLHDTIEDSADPEATRERIRVLCGSKVLSYVEALTRRPDERYVDYIQRIASENLVVRRVKRADLVHNCDTSRLPQVTAVDAQRIAKYELALLLLAQD